MSNATSKVKHSSRRHKDEAKIKKQLKIAKRIASEIIEPHKLNKVHATDYATVTTSYRNLKKLKNEPSAQENKLLQDMDNVTDKRSNGLKPESD